MHTALVFLHLLLCLPCLPPFVTPHVLSLFLLPPPHHFLLLFAVYLSSFT
jgi:hypothetical protein